MKTWDEERRPRKAPARQRWMPECCYGNPATAHAHCSSPHSQQRCWSCIWCAWPLAPAIINWYIHLQTISMKVTLYTCSVCLVPSGMEVVLSQLKRVWHNSGGQYCTYLALMPLRITSSA